MKHLYRAVFKMDTNALVRSELWVNQRENYIQEDKAGNQQPNHARGREMHL